MKLTKTKITRDQVIKAVEDIGGEFVEFTQAQTTPFYVTSGFSYKYDGKVYKTTWKSFNCDKKPHVKKMEIRLKMREKENVKNLEKHKLLKESMAKEECELISDYVASDETVYYLYKGLEYKTTPYKWKKERRAHKLKCIQYTTNHIKELFKNENCELLDEYKNNYTYLSYKYKDETFKVRFDDWKTFGLRPHLGKTSKKFYYEDGKAKPWMNQSEIITEVGLELG